MEQSNTLRPKKAPNTIKMPFRLQQASDPVIQAKEQSVIRLDVDHVNVVKADGAEQGPDPLQESASTEDSSFSSTGDEDLASLSYETVKKVLNLIERKQSTTSTDEKVPETSKETEPMMAVAPPESVNEVSISSTSNASLFVYKCFVQLFSYYSLAL